ncbi:MAG: 3-hydroxyacyl-CoA dehydrogenase family protein [Leptospiraceae bacterium]|nr:3-hydroxyacyl-CoA dehydrogenase family protein [Leptospiraceae bacterium]MDW7976106.1 3-hydroxyacyl-CoA dehydrogenase family protein [Leptospiraceae bacterium]
MKEIKNVTLIGANGTMGSGSAAILAAFGNLTVYMIARTLEKAQEGIEKAVESVRSDVIRDKMIAATYEDLEDCVSKSDWVFEAIAETYEAKLPINERIAKSRRPGTIVSTVSSGLSIEKLASVFDDDGQKYYYGTHFFNPPYKLTLCELITHPKNDPNFTKEFSHYLEKVLIRHVVICNDKPGFAGNRIGFQFMNESAIYAERFKNHGGIYLVDQMLSGYTGRAMSPLATIDLVGLDVHKAIVDNIYEHTNDNAHNTFKLPEFMQDLINQGALGNKAGRGLYKREKTEEGKTIARVYNIAKGEYEIPPQIDLSFRNKAIAYVRESDYRGLANHIKNSSGSEAELVRYFIARYISYALSLVPEVTDIKGVDGAMGFGFNWVPPTAWIELLGGVEETIKFIEKANLPVPDAIHEIPRDQIYTLKRKLDYRQLFRAV